MTDRPTEITKALAESIYLTAANLTERAYNHAVSVIDERFGEGYSIRNPQSVCTLVRHNEEMFRFQAEFLLRQAENPEKA